MTRFADLAAMDGPALRDALAGPPEEVVRLLRVAAEEGVAEAQLRLGQMLLDGIGARCAPAEALRWFGAAAQAGDAMGMNMVGRCTEHGWGTRADTALAAQWYRAAADRGLDWGMYNLATLLALGEGVAQDRAAALALFERAAALGHAKSITMVGSFHEDGWAVPRDLARAAEYYRRGAEGGDFRGQFNHARLLIDEGRLAEAQPWLTGLRDTATPRFLAQVRGWIEQHPDRRVREMPLDLSSELAYANVSH